MIGPFKGIGKIRKSHGLKGELRIFIEEDYLADFKKAKILFLGNPDNCIPYFITSQRSSPNLLVLLEEVDTKEKADALGKVQVLLPESQLTFEAPEPEESNPFKQLIGYTLYNQEKPVSEIVRIDAYPQQEMIVCIVANQEKLIPLHESLIVSIDPEQKIIVMEIPEGLLEL